METGKLGFVQTAVPEGSVVVTAEHEAADSMHVQAPLATFYVRAMTGHPQPSLPPPLPPPVTPQLQPTQAQLHAGTQDAPTITLPISTLCPKQPLPILTLHIAGGVPLMPTQAQRSGGVVMPLGVACSSKTPKSVGKHVCQYCGRDCQKPSVLEKHLRCHTGERPYPCATCGISFKTQSNLYKHKRTQAHARITSESDRGSVSSQESLHSSRDTCFSSSFSLDTQSQDCESQEGNEVTATQPLVTTEESGSIVSHGDQNDTQGSGTARALQQAALVGFIAAPMEVHKEVLINGVATAGRDSVGVEGPRLCSGALVNLNRLQRQEATLSPDSMSLSRGKSQSQSHDSTDSGFSDSGEHHWTSSPGSSPHNHSMESLTESSMEVPEHQSVGQMDSDPAAAGGSKSKVSVQEKRQLEERISKIISKNDALMDDKHLENVRPRKTVLSKQGSIDLPMPYTYKDSFHFEIRSATTSTITTSKQVSITPGPDRKRIQAFCSSLPSQHADSLEHAPLTRSSSLPFSESGQHTHIAGTTSPQRTDSLTLSRRSSAGHLHSLKLGAQSMDQHTHSHRSLVRQAAVDCLPEVSPTERGSLSSLSLDTDCTDTTNESTVRKGRRKRSQKFDYNKWYVYGGGTFRKLYGTSSEKEPDRSPLKTQKALATSFELHDENQDIQISRVRDLVSGTSQVSVSTANTRSLSTMQSVLCHSASPGVGLALADTTRPDRRNNTGLSSYVLLQGSMLETAGSSPQQGMENRVIQDTDNFTPKSTLRDTSCEIVPKHTVLPSERKKQRTEEDISIVKDSILSVDTEMTDGDVTNAVNQSLAPMERESNRPRIQRQDSLIYPHTTPRQPLQKRHSSPLCVVSVSRSPELQDTASSTTSTTTAISLPAKTSFLPMYQLKLPQTSGSGESYPRRRAPLIHHSFSSSQIFTTCAPRSGYSDSISSFTTLTQSQPITPITLIHSQQTRSNGSGRLIASGLPAPVSTWSPPAGAVGGLMHNFSALGVPYPAPGLRTTNNASWTAQSPMFAMVSPTFPGQSYACKTVLAQDQFGSITTPRHIQSVMPARSYNQTSPTSVLFPEQPVKLLTDVNDRGSPVSVQCHVQQVTTFTDLAQNPTATSTIEFSTCRPIEPVTGVTLEQTAALAAVQCQIQQITPVAGLYQKNPYTPITVTSINQPVRDVSVSQTALPVTLQYHIQQALPASGLSQSISAKPNTMFATAQPVKPTREMTLNQTAAPVTMQCQIQQVTPVMGLAQNLPVTPNTIFCTSQPVKHLTNMSLNQTKPVAVQHQMQELAAVTPQLYQRIPATSTRIVSNSRAVKHVREMSFSQATTPVTVQYHIQQETELGQNLPATPITKVMSSQPIKQVIDMALQQAATPATVQCYIQRAAPVIALSQRSSSSSMTTASLSQPIHSVTDEALKQAGQPVAGKYHVQQPTTITPISHSQSATPATVFHSQPPTAVSVRSACQSALPGLGLENSQTAVPIAVIPRSPPGTPVAGVVQHLQTCTPTSAAAQGHLHASTAPVQGGGSTFVTAPPESTTHPPGSPSLCPLVGIASETGSTAAFPKESLRGGNEGRLGGVPQDTFFMRTPDLQIVMQIISDEQLALMAPQIESGDCKQGAGCPSVVTGSTQASKTETRGQHSPGSQDMAVNVFKTNNSSNDMNSTQGGPICSTIMSTNGSIMAQPGCSTLVSTAEPSCPDSLLIKSNSSPQTVRHGERKASVELGTAQSLYKPDQTSTETRQAIGPGMTQNPGVGQRDGIPAQQLILNGKSSRTEHGSEEAHIPGHKQQLSAWPTSLTLDNPVMPGCISKVPESHQQSSLSWSPSSVMTEKAYPLSTPMSLPSNVGVPVPNQKGHLSGVSAGFAVSIGSSGPVSTLRVVDDEPPPPLLSAYHTAPPAAHHPSVSHHFRPYESSSQSVFQSGMVPCRPDLSDTAATAQANPLHCELAMLNTPQALSIKGQLAQTISAYTVITASRQDSHQPQPSASTLGMPLLQPSGSLQVLRGQSEPSQLNGSSVVFSGVEEKNSLPASPATALHQVGSASASASHVGQHKRSPVACISPVPPAGLQCISAGSAPCPAVGQHKPLCPGDACEGCNHVPQSRSSATVACVPGKTSGEPQQSQRAMGQAERPQRPSTRCRVELKGAGGAVEQDQGDARSMGVGATQACIPRERTPRREETPCSRVQSSSSISADKEPGDGVSPQSPLPLGGRGSERPGHVPKEPWLGAKGEDRERMKEKENNNKLPLGQDGSDGGGGGHDAGGANERMEETSSHEPIQTYAVPPPPPPPPSLETSGSLLNLHLQLDTNSSHGTPLQSPSHLTSNSTTSSSSSSSNQSTTVTQTSSHLHPFARNRTQAHSVRANFTRCYQEPGEAQESSPGKGAAPPPCSSPSDLPLHSPSETVNHSEADWKAHTLFGSEQTTAACLNHSREAPSEDPGSHHHRLWTEVQISATGDWPSSQLNGPAPCRTHAAKTRSGVMASLSGSLRRVRKCMEDEAETSSSSDDEGKLVIEFETN